jgi:cell division protein FtsW
MPRRPRSRKVTLKVASRKPDWVLAGLTLGLTIIGVIMVGNASVVEAFRDFGDKYYYLKLQVQWAGLGILAFVLASFFHYRFLERLAPLLMIAAIVLLAVVLIPGVGTQIGGARRWLIFGSFRFQPAEITKLAFVLYLAAFLTKKQKALPFLILSALIVGLVMLEPDLGTTVVIITSGLVVYFASGAPLMAILGFLTLGLLGGLGLIYFSPYRRERLLTFFNPGRDPLGASYHIRQILLALGSGGLLGLGLGQSRQKYEYLPAVMTDSIFAVIAEELGFIGGALILLAFLLIIWRGFKIALEAPDRFGQLLAVGITAWIGLQALINLAAMVALVPLTGVPLPFISYGGSSLVVALAGMGILINISKHKVVKK